MDCIRVVVVDDSALVRGLLQAVIDAQPDMRVVGCASDPIAAREVIRELSPDVVTLDVEMPRMDGLEFLSRLMRLRPTPVVMVSTLTGHGAETTLRALELGAVDFVPKPRHDLAQGLPQLATELCDKLRAAARSRIHRRVQPPPGPVVAPLAPAQAGAPARLAADRFVFIGASTGGTEATREVLLHLPEHAPPVLIAQHMPPGFTRSYAARLDGLCRIRVQEAQDGQRLLPGHAYIAPGGLHLSIERRGGVAVACVRDGEPVNRHKPSVEVLFASAARVAGARALGVMLTGMGGDGARAMRLMRDAGAWTVCQDEATSVVFGMPREAIAHGAACEVLPLPRIGPALLERLRGALLPTPAGTTPAGR